MSRYLSPALKALGALAIVVFAVVLSFPFLHADCGYDREVFRYMGMVIANGGVPYVDGFDHKPPLLYFLNALTHRWDPVGPWIGETFLLAFSALALYVLAIRRRWPLPVLYPLYFISLLRAWAIGLTRSYSATFTVIAFAVLLLEVPYAAFLFGLLFAACFFLQQNDAMPLAVLFVFYLLRRKNFAHDIGWAALGALLVVVPIFSWFLAHGAFNTFIDQAFRFNTRLYVSDSALMDMPDRLKRTITDFGFRHWYMVVGVLFAFLPRKHFWNRGALRDSALTFVFLGLFAEMVMMNISGVLYRNYFIGIFAWIVLFTGELFRVYSAHEILPKRFVFFLLLATLFVLPNPNLSRAWKDGWTASKKGFEVEICGKYADKYAREVAGQRGQFYSISDVMLLGLNRHYNIIAPTIWVYTHFWNQLTPDRWDADRTEFRKFMASFDQYKTRYIYSTHTRKEPPFPVPHAADLNVIWFDYLEKNYVEVEWGIWKRKP